MVSVPLRGLVFLIRQEAMMRKMGLRDMCFRPLTGSIFLNERISQTMKKNLGQNFRPLTGSIFLTLSSETHDITGLFFRFAAGILFLKNPLLIYFHFML